MIVLAVLYIALGFGAIIALAAMILRIGTMLAECPDSGPTVRAAAVTMWLTNCIEVTNRWVVSD